jgi:putative nucleotidyltransferase with HDIG domain
MADKQLLKGRELLNQILRDLHGIPSMPDVIQKVMVMTQDPDCSAGELNKVMTVDQALTANVLKLCNSAYYGLPRTIGSVTQAITYLGFRTIRNLVLSSFLSDVYGGTVTGMGYSLGGLWKHSVAAAVGAQMICEKLRRLDTNEIAFTAGLLHDVGKTILAKHAKEHQKSIQSLVQENGMNAVEAERQVLGFDHAALGAKVADVWNFPPALMQAIGLHHDPLKAKGDNFLVHVVHVANHLAVLSGYGIQNAELLAAPLYKESLQELSLTQEDLDTMMEDFGKALHAASPFVSMQE